VETRERLVAGIQAVLNEQFLQRSLGFNDPSMIRKASLKATERSKMIAYSLAKADARAVTTTKKKRRSFGIKPMEESKNKKRQSTGAAKRLNESKESKKEMRKELNLAPFVPDLSINRAAHTICLGYF